MSLSNLQIIHVGLLIVLCALCLAMSFFTSEGTPKAIRYLLAGTPFLALEFIGEKMFGGYIAYPFDVILLLTLIVYVVAIIWLLHHVNAVKCVPPQSWDVEVKT